MKKTGAKPNATLLQRWKIFCLYRSNNTRTVAPMKNTPSLSDAVPTRAETADAALRADIRRLGHQLGDTLIRQHGKDLLDTVEEVRHLAQRLRQNAARGRSHYRTH